jgi:hypothetical protein
MTRLPELQQAHAVWAAEKSDVMGRIVYPGFVPVVRTCSLLYLAQAFMPGFVAFLVRDPDFAGRVGPGDYSPGPLTEPDLWTTHPALWVGISDFKQ